MLKCRRDVSLAVTVDFQNVGKNKYESPQEIGDFFVYLYNKINLWQQLKKTKKKKKIH